MSETCGCGAKIDGADTMQQLSEWRHDHLHDAPPLRTSGSGGAASTERGYNPIGFVVPEQTRAM